MEVEAANRAAQHDFFLDLAAAACAPSSTLGGRVTTANRDAPTRRAAATNRGEAAVYNLDAKAEAVNRAARRDFILDLATTACVSSSTSGGWRRHACLPQPRSGGSDTSPPDATERPSASDLWDLPIFFPLGVGTSLGISCFLSTGSRLCFSVVSVPRGEEL